MDFTTVTIANGVSGGENILSSAPGANAKLCVKKIVLSYDLKNTATPCYLEFDGGATAWTFRLNAGYYGGLVLSLGDGMYQNVKDGWLLDANNKGTLTIKAVSGDTEVDPASSDEVRATFFYQILGV